MSVEQMRREAEEKLSNALERVSDEATFCEFLQALATDWFQEQEIEKGEPGSTYGSGALGWENGTIGEFLGAASVGLHRRLDETNVGRRAAEIMWVGKIYE